MCRTAFDSLPCRLKVKICSGGGGGGECCSYETACICVVSSAAVYCVVLTMARNLYWRPVPDKSKRATPLPPPTNSSMTTHHGSAIRVTVCECH